MKVSNEMKEDVLNYLGIADDDFEDGFFLFYHRCMKADMHYADADRYAILNTMFDYDIGMENARAIDTWMYEHDKEIYELNPENTNHKSLVALAVAELGLNLDFSGWIGKDYEAYKFFDKQ